jgi:hypothetical protein
MIDGIDYTHLMHDPMLVAPADGFKINDDPGRIYEWQPANSNDTDFESAFII